MLNSENYQTILSPQYCTHATSILYQHYKCLVLALQASCISTTSVLYWRYKPASTDVKSIFFHTFIFWIPVF